MSVNDNRTPAQRGWDLLEAHGPHGWKSRLNPVTLDVGSIYECVLSQAYGGYNRGAQALFSAAGLISPESSVVPRGMTEAHGFEVPEEHYRDGTMHDRAAALTQEWVAMIEEDGHA